MDRNPPSSFVLGVLLGVIAVFLGMIALQSGGPAYAQSPDGGGGQGSVVVQTGSSQATGNDILFIINNAGERKTLACYRVTSSRGGLALLSTREITWDLKVLELNNEKGYPSVTDVKKKVEEAEKSKEKGAQPPGGTGKQ